MTETVTRLEYLIFVFTASVGVLQLVAIRAHLKGMLFIRKPAIAYPLSIAIIGFAFYWFFQRDNRIDTVMRRTGLEGSGMFYNFCSAAFAAVVFTLVISSLIGMIWHNGQNNDAENTSGLDALKEKNYFEALKASFRSKKHKEY